MIITVQYVLFLIIGLILTGIGLLLETDYFTQKIPGSGLRKAIVFLIVIDIIYLCFNNFPVTLTLLVFISGIIALIDQLFFARKRKAQQTKPGIIVENARSFFPVLLLVWVIRSFIVQPYHVPSGSLEPTIMTGDFIAADQFSYGLRFPIFNKTIVPVGKPKIGDIVLFYNPVNPTVVFIKRVIGTPGDHIVYKDKVLTINGVEAQQQLLGYAQDMEPGQAPIFVERRLEDLNGVKHQIYVWPAGGETDNFDFTVPQGQYFMMGDNRDDSDDSRSGFGSGPLTFVPEQNLIAKAFVIWMNWDPILGKIHWDRIGKIIH